jgi:hypothetical protein
VGFDKKAVGSLWTPHPGHTATPPLMRGEEYLESFPIFKIFRKIFGYSEKQCYICTPNMAQIKSEAAYRAAMKRIDE